MILKVSHSLGVHDSSSNIEREVIDKFLIRYEPDATLGAQRSNFGAQRSNSGALGHHLGYDFNFISFPTDDGIKVELLQHPDVLVIFRVCPVILCESMRDHFLGEAKVAIFTYLQLLVRTLVRDTSIQEGIDWSCFLILLAPG